MYFCVLLMAIFTRPPLSIGFLYDLNEEYQVVCIGKEFRLPVYSTSRIVTFTPTSPPGQKRVIFQKTFLQDSRFEWTRDKMLVLKKVTPSDQGRYSIMLTSEFTYETIHLTVSECIKPYKINYGKNFQLEIPQDGFLLEFSPRESPPESKPVLLWNRTDPEMGQAGRGRLRQHGRLWVAEKVTHADQGNYTMRDEKDKVLSCSTLTVQGHTFNITRFTKEYLNLPLFVPVHHATLLFTPARSPDNPGPPTGLVQLIREGQIVDDNVHQQGRVSLGRNGSLNQVVITGLTTRNSGVYDIRDRDGNLVSSTILNVIDKFGKWRAILKSFSVPSGMFVSLAGFILFMKRFPNCSLSKIITGLRANNSPPADAPRINIQDYSPPCSQPSDLYAQPEPPGTPRKWSTRVSAPHVGCTPVTVDLYAPLCQRNARVENQEGTGLRAQVSSNPASSTSVDSSLEIDIKTHFPMPGAVDCLHSTEDCAQFQIKKDEYKVRWSKAKSCFSTLPLDTETAEDSSVYTSDKLNFL